MKRHHFRFGNLTSRTTTTSAGASVVATPAVATTNRLASRVYDPRGNLTGFGGAGYTL